MLFLSRYEEYGHHCPAGQESLMPPCPGMDCSLHEASVPEVVIQWLWRLQEWRSPLQTEDGRLVQVIHPGIWNVESGPDFHDAMIRIGGEVFRGAVEIHLVPRDWVAHRHLGDPAYDGVVLHVVFQNPGQHQTFPQGLPLLVLEPLLSKPISAWQEEADASLTPWHSPDPAHAGPFAGPDEGISKHLDACGQARLLSKAEDLGRQISRDGLNQTAYAAMMDVMGYKRNRAPFRQLAREAPLDQLQELSPFSKLAFLLGKAGFLPASTADTHSHWQPMVQALWATYWPHAGAAPDWVWTCGGQRPANHPLRRLVAAWLLLEQHQGQFGQAILSTFQSGLEQSEKGAEKGCVKTLLRLCTLPSCEWDSLTAFNRSPMEPRALLGRSRILDLITNVCLPIWLHHCLAHDNDDGLTFGFAVGRALPRLQHNRKLEEALQVFFVPPARGRALLNNACRQQGLLKLYEDWKIRR